MTKNLENVELAETLSDKSSTKFWDNYCFITLRTGE